MPRVAAAVLGATAFIAGIALVPGIPDAATAGRWSILAAGLPLAHAFSGQARPGIDHLLGATLVAWAALSAFWAPDAAAALARTVQIGWVMGFAFVIGAETDDVSWAWRGLAAGIAAQVPLVAWQAAAVPAGVHLPGGGPAGLFVDRDVWAATATVALVGAVSARDWWFAAGPAAGLALSSSRAALVALGLSAAVAAWRRAPWVTVAIAAAGAAVVTAFPWGPGISDRVEIWSATVPALTLLGHGAASYRTDFAFFDHAHNDFLEIAYELGVPGIVLAAGIAWRGVSPSGPGLVLAAVMALATFTFPFELPVTAFAAALAAGAAVRGRRVVRDRDPAGGDEVRRGGDCGRSPGSVDGADWRRDGVPVRPRA